MVMIRRFQGVGHSSKGERRRYEHDERDIKECRDMVLDEMKAAELLLTNVKIRACLVLARGLV